MTVLLTLALVGGVTFVEQDIQSPWLGRWSRPAFRCADLDGNGQSDLLLPDAVVFQHDRSFRSEHRVAYPVSEEVPLCTAWGGRVFLRYPGLLEVVEWQQGAEGEASWQAVLQQDIAFPTHAPDWRGVYEQQGAVRFLDFLYDLDADGIPEIIVPSPEGLHVYSRKQDFYEEVVCFDVLQASRIGAAGRQNLWPPRDRVLVLPSCERRLTFELTSASLRVFRVEGDVFEYSDYVLDGFAIVPDKMSTHRTNNLPDPHTAIMHLNNDAIPDFAAWREDSSRPHGPLTPPVHILSASTDGGRSFQTIRSQWQACEPSFVDYDGDGDLDIVEERTDLYAGGRREVLNRLMTQRTVSVAHELRIHLQDDQGVFASKPAVIGRFSIAFGEPLYRESPMVCRYKGSGLISLAGDCNGDGFRDVLIQDRPDRLALYFGGEGGFETAPAATVRILDDWDFNAADVDCDGKSDIIVSWLVQGGEKTSPRSRVFLAREVGP